MDGDEEQQKHVYDYFKSVPRAMFTTFRCSFGDCSTADGISIPESIETAHGWGFALLYCFFVFFITVCLFNVISAIFLDSTIAAAAERNTKKALERLEDEERWARSVATIIKACLLATPDKHTVSSRQWMTESVDKIAALEFDSLILDGIVRYNDEVKQALNALDIEQSDHKRLSDILDPDHSGTIGVLELTSGLQRLRGGPRRSDVITVDLMVRSLQEKVDEVREILENHGKLMSSFTQAYDKHKVAYGSPERRSMKV